MLVFIFFYQTPKGLKNCHFRCHNFLFQNVLNIRQHDRICLFRFFLLHLYFDYNFVPCICFSTFNTLRPRQNGRHFADVIFRCIFLNENARISLKISLRFVPKVRINSIPALVQILAWRRPGDKPLSEPMMVSLLAHICVTRPQWVKFILTYQHDLNNDYV